MKILAIDNKNNCKNTNFGKLKKITCATEAFNKECDALEKRIKMELISVAENNIFFKRNDVNANIITKNKTAELTLFYKPAENNILKKIKNLFFDSPKQKLVFLKEENTLDDSVCSLISQIRKADFDKKNSL